MRRNAHFLYATQIGFIHNVSECCSVYSRLMIIILDNECKFIKNESLLGKIYQVYDEIGRIVFLSGRRMILYNRNHLEIRMNSDLIGII